MGFSFKIYLFNVVSVISEKVNGFTTDTPFQITSRKTRGEKNILTRKITKLKKLAWKLLLTVTNQTNDGLRCLASGIIQSNLISLQTIKKSNPDITQYKQ